MTAKKGKEEVPHVEVELEVEDDVVEEEGAVVDKENVAMSEEIDEEVDEVTGRS